MARNESSPFLSEFFVDFIDLKSQQKRIRQSIDARIAAVLNHRQYIMGPEVAELEARLCDFLGCRHAIGVSSGTDSLMIALMALTSNDWSVRKLGPRNWKTLHAFGGIVIAVIFFVSYLGRLEDKTWLAIPALSLLGGALLLKFAAWVKGALRARTA